jgi:two-component system cell cycle sensor histidine kinase/response regulator CckA
MVDDDPAARRLVRVVLESRGYRVIEAEHGADAVRLEEEHRGEIDLLLTDLLMPGIRGPDLADLVKAVNPALPIIFMTSYPNDDIRRWKLTPGIPVIKKPPDLNELAATIERLLASRKD